MSTAVIIAAVVGGGVLLIMRRIFRRQNAAAAVEPLRYPGDAMRGKTVIVTGANCGIGRAVAGELVKLRARVILACRDRESAEHAAREIRHDAGPDRGEVVVKRLDLASLSSVREFCEEINKEESTVDVLINNAGVFQCPYATTEDGFEMQLGVNHLGHFLLTHLLLDRLRSAAAGRVVVVTSKLYKYGHINFQDPNSQRGYDKAFCYSQSKLANLLFCTELSRRLGPASAVTVNAASPGMVRTRLGRHVHIPLLARPLFYLAQLAFFRSALQGAQTPLYLACSPLVEGVSGRYFADCAEQPLLDKATDAEAARRLWELSERMVGLRT
ncbi:hypothetical protein CRUP_008563 [Coryphaenoides rupestris]|nr:hypothetical protein CRUP_008563 [Coryphaenoides rupestris]